MEFDVPEFDRLFADVIQPTLSEVGYEVKRADTKPSLGNVIAGIVGEIHDSTLVVAEVTTQNPNVMYELGVAHTMCKPTIVLTQDVDALPFDVGAYYATRYETKWTEIDILRKELATKAGALLTGELPVANPVTDALSSEWCDRMRSATTNGHKADGASPIHGPLVDETKIGSEPEGHDEEESGLLDWAADFETSISSFAGHMEVIGQGTEALTTSTEQRTASFQQLASAPELGSALKAKSVADSAARDLHNYAKVISEERQGIQGSIDSIRENGIHILREMPIRTAEDKEQMENLMEALLEQKDVIATVVKQVSGLGTALQELRNMKLSGKLSGAANSANGQLSHLIEQLKVYQSFVLQAEEVLSQRLSDLNDIPD